MEESLTQSAPQVTASQEPTVQTVAQPTADGNQETISTQEPVQGQEAVSTTPAETNPSGVADDDGLAKFAKGQGYTDEDVANMSEREKKTLLSLKKNVDQFRNPDKKLTDQVVETVDAPVQGESEDDSFKREFRAYKYEKQVDDFWKDGNKDRSLEPAMAKILNDKVAELTPVLGEAEARKYAFNLSRDLNTLYVQAQIATGGVTTGATIEAVRQEERDSIKRQIAAAPEAAHAVQSAPQSQPKVTLDWIRTEYNSKNPEHVKLVNEFYSAGRK